MFTWRPCEPGLGGRIRHYASVVSVREQPPWGLLSGRRCAHAPIAPSAVAGSGGLPLEIENEEAFEHLEVGEVDGPAVGDEDGAVEGRVGVLEPGRAGVVEVGERALTQLVGVEVGRVEPAVAESDELSGGGGDRLALLVGRARERERLEACGGGVAEAGLDLAELGPGGAGP
jgi:hypothetical protein